MAERTAESSLKSRSCEGYLRKKELAAQRQQLCPSVPPKLRKRWFPRGALFDTFGCAKPVCFKQEVPLSVLYRKDVHKSYIDQVFDNRIKIGEGSFGYVYKARSKDDGKYYAIKYLKERSMFHNYAEIHSYEKIGPSDYCVGFYGAWQEHNRFYIKMEYCPISLEKYALENYSFSENELWDIYVDMLLALKHLHDKDFIHLDIKPDNILISQDGIYKLGDFGLAVNLMQLAEGTKNKKRVLAVSDGDGKYVASEVLQKVYTKSCDIFSLGISMLELATDLVLPTSGPLWHQLRRETLLDEFYQNNISSELKHLIQIMMNYDYRKRPSANELLRCASMKRVIKDHQTKPRINYLLRNATANHCNGNVNEENETPSVANVNETMIIHSKGNVDQETDCLTLITTEATTPPSHRRSSTPLTSRSSIPSSEENVDDVSSSSSTSLNLSATRLRRTTLFTV